MKSIVVPINFSPCAINAAHYAADLAEVIHADLHLIHVIQVPVNTAELMMTQEVYEEMVQAADASLKELQVELTRRTHHKVQIDTTLDAGSIAAKVKGRCQELQPYALVLGATGPTFEKFLAGSPVASLLHNLDCPVLVVPETHTFQPLRRILLACDLDDLGSGMPRSLPLLKDLREHFGSRFDILTVETAKVRSDGEYVFQSASCKIELKELYPEFHHIRKPKVEEGILEYLAHNEADLILVFPKKHGFLDFHTSQSRKVAQHSPVPVLSLHA